MVMADIYILLQPGGVLNTLRHQGLGGLLIGLVFPTKAQRVARMLRVALREHGWTTKCHGGLGFREPAGVEHEIETARCVVLLRSSPDLRAEGHVQSALRKKRLLQVQIVTLPSMSHAADLSQWTGSSSEPQFLHVVAAIKSLIGSPRQSRPKLPRADIATRHTVTHAVVFISYRRDDSQGEAGRLYDRLIDVFGADRAFLDVDDISPGIDYVEHISEQLSSCVVMVVLIGPKWVMATDTNGRRRLDLSRTGLPRRPPRYVRSMPVQCALRESSVSARPQALLPVEDDRDR